MPGGRSTRFENVWLVISVVTWRDETSSRTFFVSGSRTGPGRGRSRSSGRRTRPGRPRSRRSCGWGRRRRWRGRAPAAGTMPASASVDRRQFLRRYSFGCVRMLIVSSSALPPRPSPPPCSSPASREALKPSGLTIGTTIVRVRAHQPLRPRVAAAVAEDQLVGPLDRVLGRRPLARVVSAHLQEHRLAVAGAGVRGDLDALDRAALVGAVVERDRPHEVGVLARQALEVLAVVEQAAVGGPPAGQLGLGVGGLEGGVGRAVAPALGASGRVRPSSTGSRRHAASRRQRRRGGRR